MPSADITAKGRHFLMHETQMRSWSPNRYWYGTNFYTYGVGYNTELAVTTYSQGSPLPSTASVGFGFKSALPLGGDKAREQKLTVGQMAIANYRGKGLGSFSYAHYSTRIPDLNGLRVTAGGFFGTRQLFERHTGNFLMGLEQPLGRKKNVQLLFEWFAGRHDFGFAIPGIMFHPGGNKDHIIVVAYKIPNQISNGRHGFVLEYGFTFGGKKEASGH